MNADYYDGWNENQQSDEFEYSYHDALEEDFDEYPGNLRVKNLIFYKNCGIIDIENLKGEMLIEESKSCGFWLEV